jgi:thioesterase domain-containing protein
MAELYLPEIVASNPSGPFLLAGYSGGGVVAYEIARRLTAMGHRVPLLVLLDTFFPGSASRKLKWDEHREALKREGITYVARKGRAKISGKFDRLSLSVRLALAGGGQSTELSPELLQMHLIQEYRRAAAAYRPGPYAGRVLLAKAREADPVYDHLGPLLGWDALLPQIERIDVDGTHGSLVLEPNVATLWPRLSQAIAQALALPESRSPFGPPKGVIVSSADADAPRESRPTIH